METSEVSQRIKDVRLKIGLSQKQLANETRLNIRTIQRIENGETVPRGDSLRRIAIALQTSPDELIDWRIKEDKNVITVLTLSQLSFIAFPILGIIIPLIIWILQKDKVRKVDQIGKKILNFQISWALIFFSIMIVIAIFRILHFNIRIPFLFIRTFILTFYAYNICIIVLNSILNLANTRTFYKPSFTILK